jgi:hypothetical protein
MATPITHIVLSEKIREKFFPDKVKQDFLIGTSFADIRHLKVIKREETHYNNLKVSDLQSDNSFQAGLKFHSILDLAREKFMVEHKIYELCPKSDYIVTSIKLLEDKLFYNYISNWDEYIKYFDTILSDEIAYNIDKSKLLKWHNILQAYFQIQPNSQSIVKHILRLGYSQEMANEVNANIAIIEKNEQVLAIINKLYQEFENLL